MIKPSYNFISLGINPSTKVILVYYYMAIATNKLSMLIWRYNKKKLELEKKFICRLFK